MFSKRSHWSTTPNRLTALISSMKSAGKPFVDLTISNPTACGFRYPRKQITGALQSPNIFEYTPHPRGILSARQAIAEYYGRWNTDVDPQNIFLQASTSEGYASVFKILCNPGDTVLIPRPSYPLFEYLAQLNDVRLKPYPIRYDGEWHVEFKALKKSITPTTRVIIIVNPNNPTGVGLSATDLRQFNEIAAKYDLALIVDEVFIEFLVPSFTRRGRGGKNSTAVMTAANTGALTFTLNGISKMIGLPQMKLGWIAVSGPEKLVRQASERLEMVCDTYLSVNTPVQVALPALLKSGELITKQITKRITKNMEHLRKAFAAPSSCTVLPFSGGWYGLLSVPRIKSDEEWCLALLEHHGVLVFPGYYFDIEQQGILLVSLIVEEKKFVEGVKRIRAGVQG